MPEHAAALAFYTIFSLPSMLFIVLWTAARFYKEVAVREAVFTEIGALVGQEGTQQLMATLDKLDLQEPTWWATVVGIGIIIGNSTAADLYDAAGSVLVLMLWVYYASAIFLFGATLTLTRARLMRSGRNELPQGHDCILACQWWSDV